MWAIYLPTLMTCFTLFKFYVFQFLKYFWAHILKNEKNDILMFAESIFVLTAKDKWVTVKYKFKKIKIVCLYLFRPVSAYALFFRDTQAAIKGSNPNASFGEVSKIVASMWDNLDATEKAVRVFVV